MEPYSSNPWLCSSSSLSRQPQPQPQPEVEWSWEENKVFENLLAELNLESPFLFEEIALRVPGKTASQIKQHYEALVHDINLIQSDNFNPLPKYFTSTDEAKDSKHKWSHVEAENSNKASTHRPRKRGVPWTPEEHKLFLQGLEKYGKGDWKSISRNCVLTRTPTQIASHAQKYFIRLQNSLANNTTTLSRPN